MAVSIASGKARFRTLLFALGAALIHSGASFADDPGGGVVTIERERATSAEEVAPSRKITPIQISLIPGAQVFPSDWTVAGLSLNVFYGQQDGVWGLDLGVFNEVRSDLKGLQIGVYNQVSSGRAMGVQLGVGNMILGDFVGFQAGLINQVKEDARAVQVAVVNDAGDLTGLQVGVLNIAGSLRGAQIGLVNVNRGGEPFRIPMKGPFVFLPIINVAW